MAILEEEVWVTLANRTIKYYEDKGYNMPKYIDSRNRLSVKQGTKILVKISDLPRQSATKVTKICDDCGMHSPNQPYNAIIISRENGDGKDRCHKCGQNKSSAIRRNVEYQRTLEYCAKRDGKEYLLKEFSEKNTKKPNEIAYKSNDKFIWKCPNCKSEYISTMINRTNRNGNNCSYCANRKVNHTNSLWSTHPEIAKFLKDGELGHKITAGSEKREIFKCDKCGNEKKKIIYSVVQNGFSCSNCSDGISYPEKVMMNVLNQLNIEYETQKIFEWAKDKKYDFYIKKESLIIETHGNQHYDKGFSTLGGKSLKEEKTNDEYKFQLAKMNDIKNYIALDCRKSNLEYIQNSMLNSDLASVFNLNDINWLKSHEFACNSLVKTVCDLWNSGIKSTVQIGKIVNLQRHTTAKYLKQGVKLGWCDYDPETVMKYYASSISKKLRKGIVQLTIEDEFVRCWDGGAIDVESELGISRKAISQTLRGKSNSSGGFKWMYKEDYDKQFQGVK